MAFDEPGTGGAGEPFNCQLDFAKGTAVGDKLLLHFCQIVVGEGGQLLGHQIPLGAGSGAVIVVTGEAALHDGFCHRLTTGAAHGANNPLYLEGIATIGGYRLATVKAGGHD